MMKWADPIGLNNTFSVSLGLAAESKLSSEVSILFLAHPWIFSISKFSKIGTEEIWVSVPSSMDLLFSISLSLIFFFLGLLVWYFGFLSLHPSKFGRLTSTYRFSCSYFRTSLDLRIDVRMWWRAVIMYPT